MLLWCIHLLVLFQHCSYYLDIFSFLNSCPNFFILSSSFLYWHSCSNLCLRASNSLHWRFSPAFPFMFGILMSGSLLCPLGYNFKLCIVILCSQLVASLFLGVCGIYSGFLDSRCCYHFFTSCIYQSQMMGTIWPVLSKQDFTSRLLSCSKQYGVTL